MNIIKKRKESNNDVKLYLENSVLNVICDNHYLAQKITSDRKVKVSLSAENRLKINNKLYKLKPVIKVFVGYDVYSKGEFVHFNSQNEIEFKISHIRKRRYFRGKDSYLFSSYPLNVKNTIIYKNKMIKVKCANKTEAMEICKRGFLQIKDLHSFKFDVAMMLKDIKPKIRIYYEETQPSISASFTGIDYEKNRILLMENNEEKEEENKIVINKMSPPHEKERVVKENKIKANKKIKVDNSVERRVFQSGVYRTSIDKFTENGDFLDTIQIVSGRNLSCFNLKIEFGGKSYYLESVYQSHGEKDINQFMILPKTVDLEIGNIIYNN